MPTIKSNVKALADARGLGVRELAREINYRYDSVRVMYHDKMERYPRDLIAALCAYFGVSPSELLTYVDDENASPAEDSD